MWYWGSFVLGLVCGICAMLGTPNSREQMRERKRALREAYEKGLAAGQLLEYETGRFSHSLRPTVKPFLIRR